MHTHAPVHQNPPEDARYVTHDLRGRAADFSNPPRWTYAKPYGRYATKNEALDAALDQAIFHERT